MTNFWTVIFCIGFVTGPLGKDVCNSWKSQGFWDDPIIALSAVYPYLTDEQKQVKVYLAQSNLFEATNISSSVSYPNLKDRWPIANQFDGIQYSINQFKITPSSDNIIASDPFKISIPVNAEVTP